MNKWNLLLLKILLFLFVLNSISLCLYFTSNSRTLTPSQTQTQPHPSLSRNRIPLADQNHYPYRYSKPWPIVPSYLPWSQTTQVPFRSCEAYFGNGFTNRIDLLNPKKDLSLNHMGWFRCWFSETPRSSVCEGGGLRMDPEKIKMSRGGEILEEVIGRGEEEEMPEFQNGAFQIDGGDRVSGGDKRLATQEILDRYLPHGGIGKHAMRELVESVRIVHTTELQCNEWIEEPTLLVTRFEYANLFHTFTDWYSAYVASRVVGLPNRPHVVFVDGHCASSLEEMWRALFSSIGYAKNFSGPVCFRHAILSPLGYETPLFKGLNEEINCQGTSASDLWQHPDDQKTARLSEFGEMVRAAFGFSVHSHRIEKPASGHNVLFVRREDYLAHPRHHGKVQKRLSNEQEVFDAIKKWVSKRKECKINLVNGLFAHMSMKEQVQAIQDASVIIGAHGAGLTHIISAMPKSVILEIISSQYRRPHFGLIARWKGLEYHAIHLDGSFASPPVVLDRLNNILRSLGC